MWLHACMPEVTNEYLEEVQARSDAALPGPWRSFIEGRDHQSGSHFIQITPDRDDMPDLYLSWDDRVFRGTDQDFIAHAREDVAILLAEVRRLRSLSDPPQASA
jgi:hypothetical protein